MGSLRVQLSTSGYLSLMWKTAETAEGLEKGVKDFCAQMAQKELSGKHLTAKIAKEMTPGPQRKPSRRLLSLCDLAVTLFAYFRLAWVSFTAQR
jgi:hypothetical protein